MWIRTQTGKLLNDHYVYTFSLKEEKNAETVEPWWHLIANLREGKTETVFQGHRDKCIEMLELIIYHCTVGATMCQTFPKVETDAKTDTTGPV